MRQFFSDLKKDKVLNITNLKLLEENTRDKFCVSIIGLDNDFLDMTPKVQATKANIYKRDYIHQS